MTIHVKRKVSSESDHSTDDSDYYPLPTKCSKEEDSQIESDKREVENKDVSPLSIEGGYFQNVNNINKNNVNSRDIKSSDGNRHLLSQFPPTEKKKWSQTPCIICRRHDTRYYCIFCNAALRKEPCFREYHFI